MESFQSWKFPEFCNPIGHKKNLHKFIEQSILSKESYGKPQAICHKSQQFS